MLSIPNLVCSVYVFRFYAEQNNWGFVDEIQSLNELYALN